MSHIILSPEQAAVFADTSEPICVMLPNGTIAGILRRDITPKEPLFTPEEIAEAERRADRPGPWHTTKEVLDRLRSLEQS